MDAYRGAFVSFSFGLLVGSFACAMSLILMRLGHIARTLSEIRDRLDEAHERERVGPAEERGHPEW